MLFGKTFKTCWLFSGIEKKRHGYMVYILFTMDFDSLQSRTSLATVYWVAQKLTSMGHSKENHIHLINIVILMERFFSFCIKYQSKMGWRNSDMMIRSKCFDFALICTFKIFLFYYYVISFYFNICNL